MAYWARVAQGLSFERPPLRRVDDPALETVSLAAPINSRIASRQPHIGAGRVPQPQPEAPRLTAEDAQEVGDASAPGSPRRREANERTMKVAAGKDTPPSLWQRSRSDRNTCRHRRRSQPVAMTEPENSSIRRSKVEEQRTSNAVL